MQVITPNIVTPGSFTRASVANYWNSVGVITSAAVNEIRIGYDPLNLSKPPSAIVEGAATNLLLNSATLATQTVTTSVSSYTLSFYGTGTVTLSGSFSATITGVGVSPNRTKFTFNAAAGSLLVTVSGSITNAQLETGATATSWITTTGAASTRAADVATGGLVYSSVAEPEATWPAWNSATAYTIGQQVSINRRRYTCVVANTNRNPSTDSVTPPAWVDYGPTNRWAMFDSVVGTSTVESSGTIILVLKTGNVNGLSFMQMGADKIRIAMSDGVNVLYSNDLDMTSGVISDWYQYFTTPIQRMVNYSVTDVPSNLSGIITLVITTGSGNVTAGNVVMGPVYKFVNTGSSSATTSGVTKGIIDYSVKTVDSFGNTSWTKRGYANRMSVKLMVDTAQIDMIDSQLTAIRATPCVWIAANNTYQSLQVYGAYKDWEIEISYTTKSYISIQIEGLI